MLELNKTTDPTELSSESNEFVHDLRNLMGLIQFVFNVHGSELDGVPRLKALKEKYDDICDLIRETNAGPSLRLAALAIVQEANVICHELDEIMLEIVETRETDLRGHEIVVRCLKYFRETLEAYKDEKENVAEIACSSFLECFTKCLRNYFEYQGITLSFRDFTDGELTTISMPELALFNIILELVRNAADSIELAEIGDGMVEIELRRASGDFALPGVSVLIRDNGHGISNGFEDYIFKRGATTKLMGTGKGLAMIRDILNKYGGQISLISNSRRGAVFEIFFLQPDDVENLMTDCNEVMLSMIAEEE